MDPGTVHGKNGFKVSTKKIRCSIAVFIDPMIPQYFGCRSQLFSSAIYLSLLFRCGAKLSAFIPMAKLHSEAVLVLSNSCLSDAFRSDMVSDTD